MSQPVNKSVIATPATTAPLAETDTSGVSTLTPPSAHGDTVFNVPFTGTLSGASPTLRLSLRSNADFLHRVEFFESVELLGMDFVARILPGAARQLRWGFDPYTRTNPRSELLDCPIGGMDCGASYNTIALSGSLPADHPFGRELKGANLGTPNPDLFLLYSGGNATGTGADIIVRINVRVRCAGHAPVAAIRL
jgi:hypothetical protein